MPQAQANTAALEQFTGLNLEPFVQEDIQTVAQGLDVEEAMLWAFIDVEAGSHGFRPDGMLTMRFEAHIFANMAGQDAPGGHPNSYDTVLAAMAKDEDAALESCSWGLPQIMGFNARRCGFGSATALVLEMRKGEKQQIALLGSFIRTDARLHKAVQTKDFLTTARLYNGTGQQGYYERLANRYTARTKWLAGGLLQVMRKGTSGPDVRNLQKRLNRDPQAQPLVTNGQFDPGTEARVIEFQTAQGLHVDGVVGPATWAKLKEVLT